MIAVVLVVVNVSSYMEEHCIGRLERHLQTSSLHNDMSVATINQMVSGAVVQFDAEAMCVCWDATTMYGDTFSLLISLSKGALWLSDVNGHDIAPP